MLSSNKFWYSIAGFNGFLAIVMGAVAAHAIVNPYLSALADKASIYQLTHAVVLLWLASQQGKYFSISRLLFLVGIVLFCGSLYLKSLAGWDAATRLAPLGGTSFMLGWIMITLAKQKNSKGSA